MNRQGANPALAGLASLAALLGLTTLVATQTWFARTVWFVVVLAGLGHLTRRWVSRSGWVVVPVQLVGIVFTAVWGYAASTTWFGLPTGSTIRRFGALFTEFGTTAATTSAPMPSNPGVEVTLALIGAALALLVDVLAVTKGAPAAAGLPLLTAFLAAAANSGAALPAWYFLCAALAWLLLLARHSHISMRGWASTTTRPMEPLSGSGLTASRELRFGTIARRVGVIGIVTALAVPAVLPHLPPRYLLDGLARSADGRGNAKVGFSSTLDVSASLASGGSGRILTYRTTAPRAAPLRVLATAAYDGVAWSRPSPTLGRSARLDLAPSVPRSERTLVVESNGLDPPALATMQPILSADLSGVAWNVDEATSDVYVQSRPASYSTTYLEPALTSELLRNGVDGRPGPDPLPTNRSLTAALEVDRRSAPAVMAASSAVTAGSPTPFDAAVAIQEWLRDKGGFSYSLVLTEPPVSSGTPVDPLTAFLSTKQGYCVQFASAMVMMSRSAGIPARMAIGFLPGSQQEGLWTVTSADAHAWPELFFPGAGWVRFEPTPSVRTGPAPAWTVPATLPAPVPTSTARATQDPLDRPDREPSDAADDAGDRTELDVPFLDRVIGWFGQGPHILLLVVGLVLLGALVLPVTAAILRRARAQGPRSPEQLVEEHWEHLTGDLADLGISLPAGATLRAHQAHVARAGYLNNTAQASLAAVVDSVELARYARPGQPSLQVELDPHTRLVVHQVARTRSWRHRARARLLPGSARAWWASVGRTARSLPSRLVRRLRG